jgi:hypothetical protein
MRLGIVLGISILFRLVVSLLFVLVRIFRIVCGLDVLRFINISFRESFVTTIACQFLLSLSIITRRLVIAGVSFWG